MAAANLLPGMGPSTDRTASSRALKDLVRKAFDLDPDAAVFVAELTCGETDCPDAETVVALHRDGERIEFRFDKPISEVNGADIEAIAAQTKP